MAAAETGTAWSLMASSTTPWRWRVLRMAANPRNPASPLSEWTSLRQPSIRSRSSASCVGLFQ